MLTEIRIDEALWTAAGDERRREWRLLISELLEHCPADHVGGEKARLHLAPCAEGTTVTLETPEGATSARVVLPSNAMGSHFRAYLDVCHQMMMLSEGSHSARLEALDMAKRVTHDRAAKSLMQLCGPILPDHGTARRFFSLLTSLLFDTSRMHRGHRVATD